MHTALLSPGETTHRQFGALLVRIDRHHEGVTINVIGEDDLRRQFTDLAEGRKYVAFLAQAGRAGQPVHEIVQAAGVLTSAAAVFDQIADEVLENAKPATLDAFRQPYRKVRNTRTRAYLKPPTAPMLRLMRQHTGGIVTLDGRANWLTLAGIADRGYGQVHETDGKKVLSVRLNQRGMAAIENKEIAA